MGCLECMKRVTFEQFCRIIYLREIVSHKTYNFLHLDIPELEPANSELQLKNTKMEKNID